MNYRSIVEQVRVWPVPVPLFVKLAFLVIIPPLNRIHGGIADHLAEVLFQ